MVYVVQNVCVALVRDCGRLGFIVREIGTTWPFHHETPHMSVSGNFLLGCSEYELSSQESLGITQAEGTGGLIL